MPFEVSFPTRHTDAFAGTGFVHAGVLLSLTEMAYAAFEAHRGIGKPAHVVAVQRATEAIYQSPLGWEEGATLTVVTLSVDERGFDQEFKVRSESDGRAIARFVHHWVWFDTQANRPLKLSEETQERLREE